MDALIIILSTEECRVICKHCDWARSYKDSQTSRQSILQRARAATIGHLYMAHKVKHGEGIIELTEMKRP